MTNNNQSRSNRHFSRSPGSHRESQNDPLTSEIFETDIHALATDASGVGRDPEGRIVFVKDALPGETVRYKLTEKKKNFSRGTVTEILKESHLRAVPPCPYYSECGGCQIQHIKQDEHLNTKSQWLLETLRRVGRYSDEEVATIKSSLHSYSGSKFGYRQRVRVHFDGKNFGFKKEGSNEVEDIQNCLISHPLLQASWLPLKEQLLNWATNEKKKHQHFDVKLEIEMTAVTADNQSPKNILLEVISFSPFRPHSLASLNETLSELPFVSEAVEFQLSHPTLNSFTLHRKSFLQPHIEAVNSYSKAITGEVRKFLNLHVKNMNAPLLFWDLYSGAGTFTNSMKYVAQEMKIDSRTLGVEGIAQAIVSLEKNHKEDISGISLDVAAFLTQNLASSAPQVPNIVLLDPPRAGAGPETTQTLIDTLQLNHEPKIALYLACDAASLARDSVAFKKAGFEMESLHIFDMFPQTFHYECLAVFSNNS